LASGKTQNEGRSFAGLAFGRDLPAMSLHDFSADEETQSEPTDSRVRGCALKSLKYRFKGVLRYTWTTILKYQAQI
jgi:hypothetical protein